MGQQAAAGTADTASATEQPAPGSVGQEAAAGAADTAIDEQTQAPGSAGQEAAAEAPWPSVPPPKQDAPSCLFCLQPLKDNGETEALLCGHVYHTYCLNQYMQVTGKPLREACPMKCHGSTVVPADDEDEEADDEVEEAPADNEGEEAAHAIP